MQGEKVEELGVNGVREQVALLVRPCSGSRKKATWAAAAGYSLLHVNL
jgi:hypothetical protein